MKYLVALFFLCACTSQKDQLREQYTQKQALSDSLKQEHGKLRLQLEQTGYADTALYHQSVQLGLRLDRLNDTLQRLKEQAQLQ